MTTGLGERSCEPQTWSLGLSAQGLQSSLGPLCICVPVAPTPEAKGLHRWGAWRFIPLFLPYVPRAPESLLSLIHI